MRKKKLLSESRIPTDEASDALLRATANGKGGEGWGSDEQSVACVFSLPGLSHFLRLGMLETDVHDGAALEILKQLRETQDADAMFAMLHLFSLMVNTQPTPENPTTNVIVTLDSIIAATGLDPRTAAQRLELRAKIWAVIQFGERARVVGQRRGSYRDPATGQEIETSINTAPWRVISDETPAQPSLFGDVPVRVEIAPSAEWMRLLLSPTTSQYLPGAALLTAIPGANASGAWARVIGLSLAGFWRRHPRETLSGTMRPTRHELLTRFPPRSGPVEEILSSVNPRRAIQYWAGALEFLANADFLEKSGEVLVKYAEQRARLDRKGWQDEWLNENVDLRPGPAMRNAIEGRADALPEIKSRDIKTSPKRRTKKG